MGRIATSVTMAAKSAGKAAEAGAKAATKAIDEKNLSAVKAAGRVAHQEQASARAEKNAEIAEQLAKLPKRSKKASEEFGLYHPVGGGLKLSRPVSGLHATTVPDPMFNPPKIGFISPEQLVKEKAAMFPLVGDRAAAGRYLTHVGEVELERPVRLTGGPLYMDANYNLVDPDQSAAWESGLGRVTALSRQAARAGEGGRPVYGIYTAGSATNTDFNIMGADALIQQLPYSKITKKAEKEFDRAMKEGSKTFPPIPDWPGIRSPKAEEMLLDKSNGMLRTKLFDTMGKENFQSMGFPDVAATRKAIIQPELLDIDTHQTGFRLARMDTTGRTIENPLIPSDYPIAMAGQVAGQLDVPVDYKNIFQSHFDARRLLGQPESGDYYSFSRAHPIQYADEEWLNRLMEHRYQLERKIKEGRAEGGPIDKEEMGDVDYGAASMDFDPAMEQRMRLEMGESRVRDLNQELQERIYAFQQGLISAEDLQEFFPGYSEYDLSRMFGTTDTDLPRHPNMAQPRLTPKFLADALELEDILRKETETQLREGRKHPFLLRKDMPPGWETNLAEGGGVESPEGIPPIAQDLEMQYQAYKNGGQVQSRACEDFDRQLGKMIDFHAKLGGLVDGYAKGGAVRMSNGGTTPEDAPLMDEIAYMSQALSPEGESADSETAKKLRAMIKAGKVIATAVPKALAAPAVGVYGAATSGKFGTKEGVAAGEKRAEEFVKPSEQTVEELKADPLAMEYLEKAGKFMEELETKYKLPPLMPELFGVTMGTRGLGTQTKGLTKEAVGKVRDMAKELPPIPAGLSIQPVGQTTEQWLKSLEIPPKPQGSKMEVYAPADDLGLYSKMEKAALNFKRKEGTGEAWLADFKNAGVSDEELEYSGMKDILARITQPMKRETIAVYAKQKRMPLQIVRATEGTDARDFKFAEAEVIDDVDYINSRAADIEADFDNEYPGGTDGLRAQIMKDFTDEELNDPNILASIDETVERNKKQEAYDRAYTEYYDNPYYKSYNDAGYEIVGNRDVGFTVRDPNGRYLTETSRGGEEYPRTFNSLEIAESFANQNALDMGLMKESDVKFSKYQLDRGTDYEEMKILLPQPSGKRSFHGDHWDEEDVLSHYRRQRRVDTSGKPMMYIDEIQSDWHQAGRDRGYFGKPEQERFNALEQQAKRMRDREATLKAQKRQIFKRIDAETEANPPEGAKDLFEVALDRYYKDPEAQKIETELAEITEQLGSIREKFQEFKDVVPDAPFKDNWHELTVKTILHDAAQQGFERVGFSAAKPHIDRWGTEEYAWEKVPEGWKIVANEQRGGQAGGVNLEAEARARGILKSRDGDIIKTKEDLKRIVELTLREPWPAKVERITNKVWNSMQKKDVGLHQPRKEGMLYFYDEALKKYLQKYAKKIGAEFYETETQTGYGVSDQGPKAITEKVYMFEFTPKAKDTALKGQPYKKGGAVKKMRDGGPIVSDYNTIPDYNDAGAIKLAAYEQELKRYA